MAAAAASELERSSFREPRNAARASEAAKTAAATASERKMEKGLGISLRKLMETED